MTTLETQSERASVSIQESTINTFSSGGTNTYVEISTDNSTTMLVLSGSQGEDITIVEARPTIVLPAGQADGVVIIETQAGPPGESLIGFLFSQMQPSTTWLINHNLGYRPTVELLDATNREIDGDVYHTTINQTTVLFNIPVAGTARLI